MVRLREGEHSVLDEVIEERLRVQQFNEFASRTERIALQQTGTTRSFRLFNVVTYSVTTNHLDS